MRVLFILENFYPLVGGSENLFLNLAAGLIDKNYEVGVLTRKRKGLTSKESYRGIQIRRVNSPGRALFGLTAVPKVVRMSKESDIIHTTLYSGAVAAGLAKGITGKSTILTVHELYRDIWSTLPGISANQATTYRALESYALNLNFDAYVGVSEFTTAQLKHYLNPSKKIIQIYNGMDYSEFEAVKKSTSTGAQYKLVYFGRAGVGKGIEILLDAYEELKKDEITNIEINLILPKESTKLYSRIAQIVEEDNRLSILTLRSPMERSELLNFIVQCNAVLLPSYSEGFCFAATEASALNIPIIHSGKGALPETVSGYYLVMESMTGKSLATAIKKGIKEEFDYTAPKVFPIRDMIEQYLDLYNQILSK